MTATDELRRLLDKRGVEWWAEDDTSEPAYYFVTKWFANGIRQTYEEIPAIRSRSLKGYCITPEQAIAATLGRGKCRMERADWDDGTCTWGCICSACGAKHEHETGRGWHFCPKCGAEVVE